MESHPTFDVPKFFNGFRRYSIQIFVLFLICFLPKLVSAQKDGKDKKDKQQFNKVTVCHKGETLEITESALQAHLNHGDYIGPCHATIEYTGIITPYIPQVGRIEEKIGADLTSLYEIYKKSGKATSNEIFTVKYGSKVLLDIYAIDGKIDDVINFIQEYAVEDIETYALSKTYGLNKNLITTLFPIEKLPELNLRDDIIQIVDPVYTPITNIGAVVSQGDLAQRSDLARSAFEVLGNNIKVGVLSDGFNALGLDAATSDVENGDLPGAQNPDYNTSVIVLEEYPIDLRSQYSSFDEGRAMMQIIHDVAPGADLLFHTGVKSAGIMSEGILKLKDQGCQIIVDDITHYREPFFQDGNIARTVNIVAVEGVNYYTSAGNFGINSYEAQFLSAAGYESNHDFNPGGGNKKEDIMQKVSFSDGFVRIVLQWDDNYGSLEPLTNGAEVDLDIFLITDDDDTLVNNNDNNIGGDPFEMMTFNVDGGFANANIVIQRASGDKNVFFKYIVFESKDFLFNELAAGSSTITGHANALGSTTVGAVLYKNSPAFGNKPSIASFSSRGGILMHGEAVPRNKPEVAAPNGVNTTVSFGTIYNDDGTIFNIDGDKFPNFFGTSASVPHVAGAAALILSAFDKFGASGNVKNLLQITAIDIENPGFDFASGAGFIQADSAIMIFANPKPEITKLIVPIGIIPGQQVFDVTLVGKNIAPNAQVFMGESPETTLEIVSINNSQIVAKVPIFAEEDQSVRAYNPPKAGTNGADGGYSDPVFFFKVPKSKIIVIANDTTKKYGEKLPEFTATILVDSVNLELIDTLTAEDLGLVDLTFTTLATSLSNVGNRVVRPVDITETLDSILLEKYDYVFEAGNLYIEKLPIQIIPNDLTKTYGDKIEGITYRYNFDSTNINPGDVIALIDSLEKDYKSTFRNEDSIAIVDRSRFLVNRSRFLVNGSGWTATDLALKNRSRFLVNNNVAIDIDTILLQDYQIQPEGTIENRSRFLVNGESLVNGEARYVLADRSRFLVNDGAMVNADGSLEGYEDIVVIADVEDSIVNSIYSINLISGLEVTWGTDSLHYIVPGGFISPKAGNFDISYGIGNLTILPATLDVAVDDKEIYFNYPLPIFTSTLTGYQFEENDSIVFSSITYEPTDYNDIGTYPIIPSFEFRDLVNYTINPIILGTLTITNVVNGKLALTRVHMGDDSEDLLIINSDGTNPMTLVSEPEFIRDPGFSPDGTQIVHMQSNGGIRNLWLINTDGTGLTQLTDDNNSQHADFSPDGTKVAYITNGDIAIINSDGTGFPKILISTPEEYELWPTYSPDGQEIYFKGEGGLNKVNLITKDVTWISGNINSKPAFLRDGSKIIVTRESSVSGNDIISMNPDGSEEVILHNGDVGGVTVSPDNTKIAFIKDSIDDGYGYNYDLFEMNLDGSNVHKLFTQNDSGYNLRQPTWEMFPDDIYVPDPNFEQALIDLGIDSDGILNQRIWRSDAEEVTILDVSDPENNSELPNVYAKITDLTGIEAFINLTRIYCQFNQLTDLDLSQNTALIQLWCFNNQITALDFSQNPALNDLLCYENQLTSLNVSQNPALSHLNCYGNDLSSLDVSHNTALIGLSCYDNQLDNLDISSNTDLTGLDCAGNQLTSLDVSPNTALTYLSCPFNLLDSLDISLNADLVNLLCAGNLLTSLDISMNSVLTELKCEGNQLTELDVRNGNNANFSNIVANDNNLTCISVDDQTADHSSWVVDDGIVFSNDCNIVFIPDANFEQALIDLGIDSGDPDGYILRSNAEAQDSLDVSGYSITDLTGIEAFTNLTILNCNDNNINFVDIHHNKALIELRLDNNYIFNLDLNKNISLEILSCESCAFDELDLSKNLELKELNLDYTQLSTLDLSNNFNLERLYFHCIGPTRLNSLNLSQNTALTTLHMHYTWITILDLSNNLLLDNVMLIQNGDLSCITVDESQNYSDWFVFPEEVSFSYDCAFSESVIGDGTSIVDGNVSLYPIPVYGYLTIEFTDPSVILSNVNITIYNDALEIINLPIAESIDVYGFEIDFLGLPGPDFLYYLQLYDGNEVRVFRILYVYD